MSEGPLLVVTFRVDGEDWAVDVQDVAEIVPGRPITRLPGAPPFVLGLVSWRGRTLPVLVPQPLKGARPAPDVKRRLLVLRRPEPCAVPIDESARIGRAQVGPEGTAVRFEGRELALLDAASILARGDGPAATPRHEGRAR